MLLISEPWPGAMPGLSEPALMKIKEEVYPLLNTGFNHLWGHPKGTTEGSV